MSSSEVRGTPQYKVEVWLYDLSQGLARQLSLPLLGRQLDGLWHTGVVVYGWEYFYGGGIQAMRPGHTMAGQPLRRVDMGWTSVSQSVFHSWLHGVSSRFTPQTYSLLSHNCNNFSHEAVKFLTGADMPAYITGLPEEALASPLGAMLRPIIANMEAQFRQQGGMGGAIPWSAELLTLPPLDAKPDRYHVQTPAETAQTAQAERLSREPAIPGAATTILAPTTSTHPHHPHAALGLKIVSAQSKPLLSVDKKAVSFFALMKANSRKLQPPAALQDDERATLDAMVDALNKENKDGDMSEDDERKAELLFDRLLRDWPPEQIFPVLGLMRLLVLRPRVAAYYEDKAEAVLSALLALLPSSPSPSSAAAPPMAAQAMSLCVISNFFARPSFGAKLSTQRVLLSAARDALSSSPHAPVRTIAATVLYNLSLVLPKDDADDTIELVSLLALHSTQETDAEVAWRELMALAHLLYGNSGMALLLGSGLDWDSDGLIKRFPAQAQLQAVVRDIQAMVRCEMEAA